MVTQYQNLSTQHHNVSSVQSLAQSEGKKTPKTCQNNAKSSEITSAEGNFSGKPSSEQGLLIYKKKSIPRVVILPLSILPPTHRFPTPNK